MLPTFQPAQDVSVSIAYPVDGDSMVTPASVAFEVLDQDGGIVLARAAVPAGALDVPNVVELTIAGANNTVPDGDTRALRTVRAFFAKSDGTEIAANYRYVIELMDRLTVMGNSFQTLEQAFLVRMDLPALDGWDGGEDRDLIAALITAHDRMCRLTYRYRLSQQAITWDSVNPQQGWWTITDMRLRNLDSWNDFPDDFKLALRRAQIYEADTILGGDPVGDKLAAGIVSETTGEAKMFFRNKPALRHPIGANALNVLAPYLYSSRRISRS